MGIERSINELNLQPEQAESFEVEFLNAKDRETRTAMREMGQFSYRRSGSNAEGNEVVYEGDRDDGSKIEIKIIKGPKYKSPKQLSEEEKARTEK